MWSFFLAIEVIISDRFAMFCILNIKKRQQQQK